MKKLFNKNESGRSMVEMLGVLAIIGVLSVGGIAGYRMAMNKYKANELINRWNIYKINWLAKFNNKKQQSDDINFFTELDGFLTWTGGYRGTYYTEIWKTPSLENEDICIEVLSNMDFSGMYLTNCWISLDASNSKVSRAEAERICKIKNDFSAGIDCKA